MVNVHLVALLSHDGTVGALFRPSKADRQSCELGEASSSFS